MNWDRCRCLQCLLTVQCTLYTVYCELYTVNCTQTGNKARFPRPPKAQELSEDCPAVKAEVTRRLLQSAKIMERMVARYCCVTMSPGVLKVNLNTYHELAKDFRFYEDPGDEFKFPGTFSDTKITNSNRWLVHYRAPLPLHSWLLKAGYTIVIVIVLLL